MNKLRLFIRFSKKQWLYLSLGILLSTITIIASIGLLSVAGYLICGAAIAGFTMTAATYNYLLPATAVRFFALIRIISRYGDRVLTHEATFRILKDLRVWFYKILEPLAPGYLLTHRSGDLLNRMITDIDALDKVYLRLLTPFFSCFILVILTGLFLYFFSTDISLYVTVLLLIATIITPYFAFYLGKIPGQNVLTNLALLRINVIELSNYLMDLILYGKVQQRIDCLLTQNFALLQQQQRQALIRGMINAWISILTSLSLLVVLLIGIPMVNEQQLAGANLGLLVLLVFAVFEAVNALPQACQYIGETTLAANRIIELTQSKPAVQFGNANFNLDDYQFSFKNIRFQYPGNPRKIFDNFSLNLSFGTHTAIIGSTGVGKSTLAYLATRCFDPNAGEIVLGQRSLKLFSEDQLRENICYVSQNSHLFHTSIRENLLIAKPTAVDDELLAALQMVNLKEEVLQLPDQLNSIVGEFGKQFSGGQIRRLALARAFLKAAPITILDEPLEGVDAATAAIIWKNLGNYFSGKTLIVITHQLKHIPDSFEMVQL